MTIQRTPVNNETMNQSQHHIRQGNTWQDYMTWTRDYDIHETGTRNKTQNV